MRKCEFLMIGEEVKDEKKFLYLRFIEINELANSFDRFIYNLNEKEWCVSENRVFLANRLRMKFFIAQTKW